VELWFRSKVFLGNHWFLCILVNFLFHFILLFSLLWYLILKTYFFILLKKLPFSVFGIYFISFQLFFETKQNKSFYFISFFFFFKKSQSPEEFKQNKRNGFGGSGPGGPSGGGEGGPKRPIGRVQSKIYLDLYFLYFLFDITTIFRFLRPSWRILIKINLFFKSNLKEEETLIL